MQKGRCAEQVPRNHRNKKTLIGGVINSISQREVKTVVFASASSNVPKKVIFISENRKQAISISPKISCSREVLSILVERDSHHTVCGVEGLLDSVSVVDVDVNVQHPLQSQDVELLHKNKTKRIYLVVLEEFKNSKDNVVDIAESRCLALLGVMEASGPVDGNVRGLLDE